MRKAKDITGKKFSKLTAVKIHEKRGRGVYAWECTCDCGNITIVQVGHLNSGQTKSCGCLSKLPKGEGAFNALYYKYGWDASKRGLSFDLTKEEFKNLTSKNCYYCGVPPKQEYTHTVRSGFCVYNGIDRVDNTKGYSTDNCVPCCGICNLMKRGLSYDEFISRVEQIYRYRVERKDDTAN